MSNYELRLEPVRFYRNPVNGRIMKGNVPHNKGKKWSEWMDGRKQRKVRRLLKSYHGRPMRRSEFSGRPKKQIIAVTKDGRFLCFSSITKAAKWAGTYPGHIHKIVTRNKQRNLNTKGKVVPEIRTDHHHKGIRFYYEDDPIWMTKIKRY